MENDCPACVVHMSSARLSFHPNFTSNHILMLRNTYSETCLQLELPKARWSLAFDNSRGGQPYT